VTPGASVKTARHPIAHPQDCACGRHEDTATFVAALWRATDVSLRDDPERWRPKTCDDLPPRSGNEDSRHRDASRSRWQRQRTAETREDEERRVRALLQDGRGRTRTEVVAGVPELTARGAVAAMWRLRRRGDVELVGAGEARPGGGWLSPPSSRSACVARDPAPQHSPPPRRVTSPEAIPRAAAVPLVLRRPSCSLYPSWDSMIVLGRSAARRGRRKA
jgi:hypothetical protein